MKKLYDTPEMLVIILRFEDVIANSPISPLSEGFGDLDFFEFPRG